MATGVGVRAMVERNWHSEYMSGTDLLWTFLFNPLRVSKHSVMCMAGLVCAGHVKIVMVKLVLFLC